MCSFVCRVRYRAQGEAAQLLSFESREALQARLDELLKLDTVASVMLFIPWATHEKIERIEVTPHDPPEVV